MSDDDILVLGDALELEKINMFGSFIIGKLLLQNIKFLKQI